MFLMFDMIFENVSELMNLHQFVFVDIWSWWVCGSRPNVWLL